MLDLSKVKEGSVIEYKGESITYGGTYNVVSAESTYRNPADCPDFEKGKLLIIEFMNDDTPMFITMEELNLKEWKLVS